MPKQKDENEIAFSGLQELIRRDAERDGLHVPPQPTPPEIPRKPNASAKASGRLGGLKGGKARAAKLSPKKRSQIAKKAAKARWNR